MCLIVPWWNTYFLVMVIKQKDWKLDAFFLYSPSCTVSFHVLWVFYPTFFPPSYFILSVMCLFFSSWLHLVLVLFCFFQTCFVRFCFFVLLDDQFQILTLRSLHFIFLYDYLIIKAALYSQALFYRFAHCRSLVELLFTEPDQAWFC